MRKISRVQMLDEIEKRREKVRAIEQDMVFVSRAHLLGVYNTIERLFGVIDKLQDRVQKRSDQTPEAFWIKRWNEEDLDG